MSQPIQPHLRANGRHREIFAILLMAFALLMLVSLHTTASGAVGMVLARWLRLVFGRGADVPAVFLLLAGIAISRPHRRSGGGRRAWAMILTYLVSLTSYHLIITEIKGPLSPYWALKTGEQGEVGGALGALLGARSLAAFGTWGSGVVMIALLFVGVSLYLETPVSRITSALVRWISGLFLGSVRGSADFGAGVVQELRELFALLRDKRERSLAEQEAALRATEQLHASSSLQAMRSAAADPVANDGPGKRSKGSWLFRLIGRGAGRSASVPDHSGRATSAGSQGTKGLSRSVRFDSRGMSPSAGSVNGRTQVAGGVGDSAPDDLPGSGSGQTASSTVDMEAASASTQTASLSRTGRSSGSTRGPQSKAGAVQGDQSRAAGKSASQNDTIPVQLGLPTPATAYALPPTALLQRPKEGSRGKKSQSSGDQSRLLEETLANFGVQARVVRASRGPVVTRYELQPAPGIKVSKIVNLADDVALNLAAADVRIEAPVPGKSVVGIEVPNKETTTVYLREVLESPAFQDSPSKLIVGLGKDIAGNAVVADLTKLLHVLIAGATGSGKSVCVNSIICSLLYKARPHEVKLLMIDPKRVELAVYDGIPHLVTPVVTDPKLASNALRWAVKEMESRYKKFSETGVRNIDGYNRGVAENVIDDETMPYLVVIIDELADLMLVAGNEVEDSICRLAQMARAAGIHLVIATQRPSVDVITGLIKANVPSRISFAVSSGVDSRTILDTIGAERLIGKGDMLYYPIGANKPLRAQGAWIFDKEVQGTADFWKKQGVPEYTESVTKSAKPSQAVDEADDELFNDAVQLVVETGNASISMLQRRFRVGYARAARLIDMMELQGIVGPYQGSKPREVLRSSGDIEELAN